MVDVIDYYFDFYDILSAGNFIFLFKYILSVFAMIGYYMNLSNALLPQVFKLEIGKLRQKLFLRKLITQELIKQSPFLNTDDTTIV